MNKMIATFVCLLIGLLHQGCAREYRCPMTIMDSKINSGVQKFSPIANIMESFVKQNHRFPETWEFKDEYLKINEKEYVWPELSPMYEVKPWPLRGPHGAIFTFIYREGECAFICNYRTNPFYFHNALTPYVTESDFQKAENLPKGWFCSVYEGPGTIQAYEGPGIVQKLGVTQ